ncbi:PrgI family protein [Candidatus Daviesbacteria bacterium]|nr:PrgI family protein [Candidatus Daviesbacteria bacterium]
MEPHAIPQNVTSFQFHLVGDMTLRQFLYLATGAGIAYFIFIFLSPVYPLIAWPLILISASLGAAFAFMPIASRPLDYWLGAFLKAIYQPTKRVWQKNNKDYKNDPLFNSRLVTYLSSLELASQQINKPAGIPASLPTTAELGKTVDLARQAQNLQLKILQTERTLNQIKSKSQQAAVIPTDYSNQVNKIIADLQTLVSQASQVRNQLDTVTKAEPMKTAPAVKAIPAAELKEQVKVVTPSKIKQTQMALTTFPNVINGVVTDNTGNYLEGGIAVIYDKEGLPVRALKTNKLGQFTGSTPLPNGSYRLTLEKDNLTFDTLQIELNGEVLPPLLIKAK